MQALELINQIVNSALRARSRAKRVMDDLIKYGEIHIPWLGLFVQDLDPKLVHYFNIPQGEGVLVSEVTAHSPAEKAGLRKGDVLLAVNGVKYGDDDKEKWHKVKKVWKPGSTITYMVQRGGRSKELDVTLGKVPEEVLYAWVGEHMLQHATVEVAQK